MTDQGGGQKAVAVKPHLAVITDAPHLQADLVGMAHDHQPETLGVAGVGIHDDAGVPLELAQRPALGHEGLELRAQHAAGHGRLQAHRAGCRQNTAHQLELGFGHRAAPGRGQVLRGHERLRTNTVCSE